jgi:hypothetical protein
MRSRSIAARAAAGVVAASAILAGCRSVEEIAAPQVTLNGVEVRGLSGGEADLILALAVGNPNPFDVTLVEIQGTLFLAGVDVGPIGWTGERPCAKQGAVEARIPAHLAVGDRDSLVSALVDQKPMRKALRGEVTFARGVIRRTFPMATDGQRAELKAAPQAEPQVEPEAPPQSEPQVEP